MLKHLYPSYKGETKMTLALLVYIVLQASPRRVPVSSWNPFHKMTNYKKDPSQMMLTATGHKVHMVLFQM